MTEHVPTSLTTGRGGHRCRLLSPLNGGKTDAKARSVQESRNETETITRPRFARLCISLTGWF